MEQVSDDELDHGAEEDSDKEDQDLDKMFGAWLGELDKLTQVDGRRGNKEEAVSMATLTLLILSLFPSNPSLYVVQISRALCLCMCEREYGVLQSGLL